jgi:L-malate glycosyltransferase
MNIGMVCYASVGGSGVVATELAYALALRGHRIHVISSETPFRLREGVPGLLFDRVEVPPYPLFREPQYLLALTNTIARVAEKARLDVIHAHYAVPHATAAYLARQMLDAAPGRTPKTVTTLHGTDITLIGNDPSYRRVVAFSIERSDGVTAVSRSLRDDTMAQVGVRGKIAVIPNFLECGEFRRRPDPDLRARLCPPDRYDALVIHMSNFRPVKRVEVAIEIFHRIRRRVRARFLLVGDGPVRPEVEKRVEAYGLDEDVMFVGARGDPVAWLSVSDLFLLPSIQESFGLAALEAMACEVPVVSSNVGGLPEIVREGVTGFVRPPDDVEGMAERGIALLTDPALRRTIARQGCEMVRSEFCSDRIVPLYEAEYARVLAGGESC